MKVKELSLGQALAKNCEKNGVIIESVLLIKEIPRKLIYS